MKDLKLLVCSDIHGSEDALNMLRELDGISGHDLMVVCGDFTTYGSPEFVDDFLEGLRTRVLAVPGNCDTPEILDALERSDCSLHDRRENVGGWDFFGFGGAGITSHQMPFEIEEEVIEKSLRRVAVKGGVMVTHMPAYGMNDHGRANFHAGSKGILRVAKEFEPALVLSGHIHEARGVLQDGPTIYLNPGSAAKKLYATVKLGDEVRCRLSDWNSQGRGP